MTAPATPTVTVVIPCWNNELHIAEAIDSVLAQEHQPIEIIVVDDGSTDHSAEIVDRYRAPVRRIPIPHGGQGRARNHGVDLALGTYVAFLDADDVWLPRKLRAQLDAIGSTPRARIAFGGLEQFFSPELGRSDRPSPRNSAEAQGLCPTTLLCHKEAFWAHGGFSEHLVVGELVQWYARVVDSGEPVVITDEVVARRRIHATNTGITHRAQRGQYASAIKEMLDHRRAAAAALTDAAEDAAEAARQDP